MPQNAPVVPVADLLKRSVTTWKFVGGFIVSADAAAESRYEPLSSPFESESGTGHFPITGIHVVDVLLTMLIYFAMVPVGFWLLLQFLKEFFNNK